jgi:hypothetical protein
MVEAFFPGTGSGAAAQSRLRNMQTPVGGLTGDKNRLIRGVSQVTAG